MILLFLNVLVGLTGGAYVLGVGSAPTPVRVICLIIGSLTLLSRIIAWGSGAAQAGYSFARQTPGMSARMGTMELAFLALGIFNVGIFFLASS